MFPALCQLFSGLGPLTNRTPSPKSRVGSNPAQPPRRMMTATRTTSALADPRWIGHREPRPLVLCFNVIISHCEACARVQLFPAAQLAAAMQ